MEELTDLRNLWGSETRGTNFWVPLMLRIVEVPALVESATARDVAVADMQAVVIAIEKAGWAGIVAEVVVEK